jgi:hypothetical protein
MEMGPVHGSLHYRSGLDSQHVVLSDCKLVYLIMLQKIIVIIVVAAAVFFLVRRLVRLGKGKGGCGCGCDGCPYSGSCNKST